MPKIVDHEMRKEEILKSTIDVFAKYGYSNVSIGTIAGKMGISRSTIYQYFTDKNNIYYYAVKNITNKMFQKYSAFVFQKDNNFSTIDKIKYICNDIIETAKSNVEAIGQVIEIMVSERKKQDFSEIVFARTSKFAILLKRILRDGIRKNEIRDCNIEKVSRQIVMLIEDFCFRVVLLHSSTIQEESLEFDIIFDYLNKN